MTSKISSFKLLRESMKRGAAFGILLCVGWFLYYPVMYLLMTGNGTAYQPVDQFSVDHFVVEEIRDFILNPAVLLIHFGAAAILGILQFSYLHSQEKLDFYHSIPVRRERLFGVQFLAGILLWFVPLAANLLLLFLFSVGNGLSAVTPPLLAKCLVFSCCAFLLVYSIMAFAMMLTGKLFSAVCVFGILCAYLPAIGLLSDILMDYFLRTYQASENVGELMLRFSPLAFLSDIWNIWVAEGALPGETLLVALLGAALLTVLGLLLYRKRPTEKAGTSMAFPWIARVVKFLIVVPSALVLALAFYEMGENILWGIFGWVIGLLLASGLIEFVYRLDIREIFRDRGQIAVSALASLVILAVLHFDLLGYDRYLPEKEDLTGVSIVCTYPKDVEVCYQYRLHSQGKETTGYVEDTRKDGEEIACTQNLDAAYELIQNSDAFTKPRGSSYADRYSHRVAMLHVTYHLKDGTSRKRCYEYTDGTGSEQLQTLWSQKEYKEILCPILSVKPEDVLSVRLGSMYGGSFAMDYFNGPADASYEDGIVVAETSVQGPTQESADPAQDTTQETADPAQDTTQETADPAQDLTQEPSSEPVQESVQPQYNIDTQPVLSQAHTQELFQAFQNDLYSETLKEAQVSRSSCSLQILYRDAKTQNIYGAVYPIGTNYKETLGLLEKYGYALDWPSR